MSLSSVVSGGLAVVLFTLVVRAALLPLSIRAARAPHAPASLLPLLVQIPFVWMLYGLFNASTVDGQPNGLLGQSFLGVDLGTRFFADPGALVFWLVFAALIAIAWYASHRLQGFVRVLPFFTVLVAAYVPLAAGLYLITSTAWTAVERTMLSI
jgi:YidC/Oxa1 family membrane protein insertase